MKQRDVFDILWKIITIILLILIFYWIFQLFFGGSPTLSQFNFALIIMTMGLLIKIYREVGEIKIDIMHSFNKLKEDIIFIKK